MDQILIHQTSIDKYWWSEESVWALHCSLQFSVKHVNYFSADNLRGFLEAEPQNIQLGGLIVDGTASGGSRRRRQPCWTSWLPWLQAERLILQLPPHPPLEPSNPDEQKTKCSFSARGKPFYFFLIEKGFQILFNNSCSLISVSLLLTLCFFHSFMCLRFVWNYNDRNTFTRVLGLKNNRTQTCLLLLSMCSMTWWCLVLLFNIVWLQSSEQQ